MLECDFLATALQSRRTDLAGLRGARLVTVETEEGCRWAESRIKSLTGGDKISARFMRQDFFEYTPQFKLISAVAELRWTHSAGTTRRCLPPRLTTGKFLFVCSDALRLASQEHQAIIDAIVAGNGDTAFNRLRDHVSLSNELFSDLVAALSAAEA